MKSVDEISFIMHCIQMLAQVLQISQEEVYESLNTHHIIENYILPCFLVLKTQNWIVVQNELLALMNR